MKRHRQGYPPACAAQILGLPLLPRLRSTHGAPPGSAAFYTPTRKREIPGTSVQRSATTNSAASRGQPSFR